DPWQADAAGICPGSAAEHNSKRTFSTGLSTTQSPTDLISLNLGAASTPGGATSSVSVPELNRAPPVLLHQPKLAPQATRQLSRDCRADLGYDHQNRSHRALRTRHWPILQRHCRIRC